MKKRNEIEEQYKVNLKELFSSDEAFLKELDKLSKDIKVISKYENHLLDDENTLYEALENGDNLDKRLERAYLYAHINNDCDLADKTFNEFYGKTVKIYTEYGSLCSYITPELLNSDYETIENFINKNEKLKKFERLLKEIFRTKEHTLSKQEEYIINRLSDSFRLAEDAYSKLTDVDLKFGNVTDENGDTVELTESNWSSLIESKNREIRENVFKKFFEGYKSIINTTAELLAGEVKNNNTIASIRKYTDAMSAALDRNEVSPDVYNSLIKAIDDNLDILHKQWKIRKEALGVKDLHLYDTYVPLTEKYDKKYTYDEAKNLILESVKVLGEDYVKVMESAFNNNWIDVYPNENKRGGAYCTCCYETHPYVVTNFTGIFNDVSTITHELGHAMHYYYAQNNQEYVDYSYSIFVAEVASQVNEILLALHVLNTTEDKEEKLFVLDVLMKHFKASVARQAMFAEFEKLIHEKEQSGEVLTYQLLCDEYYKLNEKYYGKDIVIDDEIRYEWSRIPHFYYNFYVYQYSTGYIAALKIANDIYNKKDGALEKYLEFLKLGCTMDPVNSLKVAGVDLTDSKSFDEAFKEFDHEMDLFNKTRKLVK